MHLQPLLSSPPSTLPVSLCLMEKALGEPSDVCVGEESTCVCCPRRTLVSYQPNVEEVLKINV